METTVPDAEATMTPLEASLERAGQRVTAPRRAVAALIERHDGHFTAADLLSDARDRRLAVGRATVFRALELFESIGLLERIDLPSGEHAYVACDPAHHHHVVCSECGRTAEVGDLGLREVVASVERDTGFEIDTHRLELYGRCPACRSSHR